MIAYARQHEDKTVIVVVPRFACSLMRGEVALPLGNAWKDWSLSLPSELQGSYRNIFTGEVAHCGGDIAAGAGLCQLSGRSIREDLVRRDSTQSTPGSSNSSHPVFLRDRCSLLSCATHLEGACFVS